MRLPRRVPWTSVSELEHMCACIYGDENDIESKIFAINRISAWKAITPLPHALESTLALLVVIVQDQKQISLSALSLRQSYAIAVIRLVNGLVDPLQVGTYARSITSIASQLGLPNWLVELRHAATHEDLPSLDLLREASRQSMSWLLYNYFLPTISPVSRSQQIPASVRPLAPVLKFYKNTMKIMTRDVSLAKEYKPRLVNILRDIERWIAESKVAANIASGEVDWMATNANFDAKEIWALEQFVDVLSERGMLVPLSKKKRQPSGDSRLPNKTSIAIWEPLLRHAQDLHADFSTVLCRKFISILLQTNANEELEFKDDPSYYSSIACWVMWAVEIWNKAPSSIDLKKDALACLLKGLGCDPSVMTGLSVAYGLLKNLVSGQEELGLITALFSKQQVASAEKTWDPQDLDVMTKRHMLMQKLSTLEPTPAKSSLKQTPSTDILASGWRTLDKNSNWKSCPIGVYVKLYPGTTSSI